MCSQVPAGPYGSHCWIDDVCATHSWCHIFAVPSVSVIRAGEGRYISACDSSCLICRAGSLVLPVQNEAARIGRRGGSCGGASSQQCRRWKKVFIGSTNRHRSSQSDNDPCPAWTENAYLSGDRLTWSQSGAFVSVIAVKGRVHPILWNSGWLEFFAACWFIL